MFEYKLRELNSENFKDMVKPGMLLCDEKMKIWLVGVSVGKKKVDNIGKYLHLSQLQEYKEHPYHVEMVEEILFYNVGHLGIYTGSLAYNLTKVDLQCMNLWYQMCEEILRKAPLDKNLLEIRVAEYNHVILDGFLKDSYYITLGQVLTEQQVKQWVTKLKLTGILQGLRESKI